MDSVRLEIAVDNAEGVLAASRGGADRLELCSTLADGGLTPSIGFLEWTLASASPAVHCMVRPRAGNFIYTPEEISILERDIRALRAAGAHGVVVGVLTPEHRLDLDAMRRLRDAAGDMRFCCHRAFDRTADRSSALEDLIALGVNILLTSGGAPSLHAGAAEVTRLVQQAAGRIEIMGGAGVRVNNAGELWRDVPVDTLHASLRTPWHHAADTGDSAASIGSRDEDALYTVREADVRTVLSTLTPRAVLAR